LINARYKSTCPVCGNRIERGGSVEKLEGMDAWVHYPDCTHTPLDDRQRLAFVELAKLSGPRLRKAAMAIGAHVTSNGRYVDDSEVRARACKLKPAADKLKSAVELAGGSTALQDEISRLRSGQQAAQPPSAPALAVDIEAAERELKRILSAWLDDWAGSLDERVKSAALDSVKHLQRTVHEVRVPGRPVKEFEESFHKDFDRLLKMVAAGVNVWLAGPAGSGKTRAVKQAAEALGLKFRFNGAIDSAYKLSGFVDARGKIVSTAFREAWGQGGLYLFDEVDASLPSAVLAFNAALSGDLCDFPGEPEPVVKHKDFRVCAAANTWGFGGDTNYVGRSKMDAAFLDRFTFLHWDYDEGLETKLAEEHGAWARKVQAARAAGRTRGLKVVISPRATLNGATLLRAGFTDMEAADATVLSRLDDASREALRGYFR